MKSCHLREDPSFVYYYAVFDHSLEGAASVQYVLPNTWACRYSDTGQDMEICPPGGGNFPVNEWTYILVDPYGNVELHSDSCFRKLFADDVNPAEPDWDNPADMYDGAILWGG